MTPSGNDPISEVQESRTKHSTEHKDKGEPINGRKAAAMPMALDVTDTVVCKVRNTADTRLCR